MQKIFLTSKVPSADTSLPTVTGGLSSILVVLDAYECDSQCPSVCADILIVVSKKERVVSLRIMCMNKMTSRTILFIGCVFLFFSLFLVLSYLSVKLIMSE